MSREVTQKAYVEAAGSGASPEVSRLLELDRPAPSAANHRGAAASRLLWNSRERLLRLSLWALLAATLLAFLLPPYYRSTTRLMPPPQSSSMGLAALSMLAGRSSLGMNLSAGDLLGIRSPGSLFIGVMESRVVEDEIIAQFGLQHLYRTRTLEDTRKRLLRNTSISEDRVSGILTVSVTDENPYRASEMARAYVDQLNRRLAEVNTSAAHRERLFLEDQLKDTKQSLDQASARFSDFASRNTAIDVQEQGKTMVAAAARVQGEMIAAESELRGLEQIYTANNVRVRAVQAKIAELQNQLQKLEGDPSASSPGSEAGTYPSIRKLPLLGVTYYDLFRQTKMLETVYEVLNQEYQLAKVQEARELPNARVLDPPEVPERKAGPIRTLIMFAGLVLALIGGAVWTLAKASWERVDPGDPRKELAGEIFATARGRILSFSPRHLSSPWQSALARWRNGTSSNGAHAETGDPR